LLKAGLFRVEGMLEHCVEAFGGGFKVDTLQQSKKILSVDDLVFPIKDPV